RSPGVKAGGPGAGSPAAEAGSRPARGAVVAVGPAPGAAAMPHLAGPQGARTSTSPLPDASDRRDVIAQHVDSVQTLELLEGEAVTVDVEVELDQAPKHRDRTLPERR